MPFDSRSFEKVDDAQITSLLAHEAKFAREEVNRSWIDWAKLKYAQTFHFAKFFMNGVQFIAVYYEDGMFVRIADNYAPCGFFSYSTIEPHA